MPLASTRRKLFAFHAYATLSPLPPMSWKDHLLRLATIFDEVVLLHNGYLQNRLYIYEA